MAAMALALPSDKPEKYFTPEIFDLTIKSLKDPGESWWVKGAALLLVGRAPADRIVPHVDLLLTVVFLT